MSDGTYRGRWLDEVGGTPNVSPEVKVLLLTMARWMDDAGHVSVPREDLAAILRCHTRKVTAKQQAAIEGGLLVRTAAGHRGRTAEFQARVPGIPAPDRGPTVGTQTGGKGGRQSAPNQVERVPTTSTLSENERVPLVGTQTGERVPTSGTQSTRKGADSRHPNTYTHAEASGHADEGVVVPLFEDESKPGKTNTPSASEAPDRFAEFWSAYPRKIAKPAAKKAWAKALKAGADPEQIIWAARSYATSPRRKEADITYTKHPAGWLNDGRYEDDPETSPITKPTGYATNKHHESDAGAELAKAFL